MKVAIATSGLGHVFRGMEGWAELLAEELNKKGIDVTLFRGTIPAKKEYDICLSCLKRTSRIAKYLSKLNAIGGWRIGLGSPVQVETWSYGIFLLWHLRKGFDLVHIKQGQLAVFLRLANKLRLLNIPFVLGNGQVAEPDFIDALKYVQFLSPIEEEEMAMALGRNENWFYVPNFVDTVKFWVHSKKACREKLNIPPESFVILTIGAIQKYHKRMDYFIAEMKDLKQNCDLPLHIIMAGSKSNDTDQLISVSKDYFGSDISVFVDFPKDKMPVIYNCADIFVLCSFKEAFGNVLVEAMSCEVPVIHHHDPILKWVVGGGGESCDLSEKGMLSKTANRLISDPGLMEEKGKAGRQRVLSEFSREIVIPKMLSMYKKIISEVS